MLNGFVCFRVVFDALFALIDICVRCVALDVCSLLLVLLALEVLLFRFAIHWLL